MRRLALLALCALSVACGGGGSGDDPSAGGPPAQAASLITSRGFNMGIHPLASSHSDDPQEYVGIIIDSYAQTAAHSDLMAHQLPEGVPWVEVAAGAPLCEPVTQSLDARVNLSQGQLYLGLTPLDGGRSGLADYWGCSALPPEWEDPAFDDPLVVSTYISWCEQMIALFDPDYLAYAIEPNMVALADAAPDDYPALLSLLSQTYAALKAAHPDLPLFVTLQVDYTLIEPEAQAQVLEDLMAISDAVAISSYPWFLPVVSGAVEPGELLPDWFERFRDLDPDKPCFVAETGAAGEDLELPSLGLFAPATETHQANYMAFLLHEAQRLDMGWVAWHTLNDLDDYLSSFEGFPPGVLESLSIFKDMGMNDHEQQPRPCLAIWDTWLARELLIDAE